MTVTAKKSLDMGVFEQNKLSSFLTDDFYDYLTGGRFTTVSTNSGTCAVYNTGGVDKVLLTTGTTEGNYSYVRSTGAAWLLQANEPMFFHARLNYVNQATTNGFVIGGFMSTTTLAVTSELDPTASYSGAVIYKRKGDTVWSVQSSNGSTKTTTLTNRTATDGTYELQVQVNNFDGENCEIIYLVDSLQLRDANGTLIKHKVAYSGAADMYVAVGTLAGTTAAQLCYVDYINVGKLRI